MYFLTLLSHAARSTVRRAGCVSISFSAGAAEKSPALSVFSVFVFRFVFTDDHRSSARRNF